VIKLSLYRDHKEMALIVDVCVFFTILLLYPTVFKKKIAFNSASWLPTSLDKHNGRAIALPYDITD
jgi:hypothetical protein